MKQNTPIIHKVVFPPKIIVIVAQRVPMHFVMAIDKLCEFPPLRRKNMPMNKALMIRLSIKEKYPFQLTTLKYKYNITPITTAKPKSVLAMKSLFTCV